MDKYLAGGWFRSTEMMYRSEVICLDEDIVAPVNIRLNLSDFSFSKNQRKLFSRHKRHFHFEISLIESSFDYMDERSNELYRLHTEKFKGYIHDNLFQFFNGVNMETAFNMTHRVAVYDGEKLIGLSFFDLGEKGLASLLSVYDLSEEYKSYSLGLFTMLLEVEFAQENNLRFYYPGYVLDKPSAFDYKLRLQGYLYYDWTNKRWKKPLEKYKEEKSWLVNDIREQHNAIERALDRMDISYHKMLYPYYSFAFMENPIFNDLVQGMVLYVLEKDEEGYPSEIIEYNPRKKKLVRSKITVLYSAEEMGQLDRFSKDFLNLDVYLHDIYIYEQIIAEELTVKNLFE
ncbi:MAG: hypothetical protein GY827_11470 [Cytophagales bacterium]|nr:hypothetical protein [Cytophagales bacterium]